MIERVDRRPPLDLATVPKEVRAPHTDMAMDIGRARSFVNSLNRIATPMSESMRSSFLNEPNGLATHIKKITNGQLSDWLQKLGIFPHRFDFTARVSVKHDAEPLRAEWGVWLQQQYDRAKVIVAQAEASNE